jgi:hypothetical protein
MESRRVIAACGLCDDNGVFLDTDGDWVSLSAFDGRFWFVKCQHSMDGALAEIRRGESDGYVMLLKTGWPEIDSQYPGIIDDLDYGYDEDEIHAEMTGAASRFNDQKVRQQ